MTDTHDPQRFSKWFRTEVAAGFAVGAFVFATVTYFMSPVQKLNTDVAVIQNQIAELKSNDLTHIELTQQEMSTTLADLQKQTNDNTKTLAEILVLMKQKNPTLQINP